MVQIILGGWSIYKITYPTVALSMDASKAFDCVEWEDLFKTLEKFGFSDNFIRWIKTLYDSPSARVLTNGFISHLFYLQRSTRQGCPLCPRLFVAIEPFAQKLRNNVNIFGISMGKISINIYKMQMICCYL